MKLKFLIASFTILSLSFLLSKNSSVLSVFAEDGGSSHGGAGSNSNSGSGSGDHKPSLSNSGPNGSHDGGKMPSPIKPINIRAVDTRTLIKHDTNGDGKESSPSFRPNFGEDHKGLHDIVMGELIHKNLKLDGVKLVSCESRQAAIKARVSNLTRFVTNMENVFNSIATKVEAFYTKQLAAGGTTVPNYDSLVSDISAKKAVVDSDLTTAQNDANTFTCTSDDPKGYLDLFRKDMQTVKDDLKEYRTSIKNLIVAIRPEVKDHDGGRDESSESTGTNQED